MKNNIELSVEEVKTTAELIEKKYNTESNFENLKVNSNPNNYSKLQEAIQGITGLKVGNRFLCKYLYESKSLNDELMVFRKDRVEALYIYFSGKNRDEYLETHSLQPVKILYVPTLGLEIESSKEISEFKLLAAEKNIILDDNHFENIITTDATQFWSYVNNESINLLICINSSILSDLDGMLRLKELLFKYTSRLVVETNIDFLFSKDLFIEDRNINRFEGKNYFFEYWNNEFTTLESLESNESYPDEIKKLLNQKKIKVNNIRESVFKILDSLVALYKIKGDISMVDAKNTIEIIQPITAKISGCEIRKLTDVISDLENEEPKDLLCVISYEKYFYDSELNEMLSYFEMFYKKLKSKHRIIRVYCVRGKRNTRGKFSSSLGQSENNNVLEFLKLTPKKDNCSSFLLVYNESPIRIGGLKLLYEQDYILSIPKQEGMNYGGGIEINNQINNILKSIDSMVVTDRDRAKLFLTYQENAKGENQMIELTELNDIALKKWLSDFSYRINSKIETNNHECILFDKSNTDDLRNILKIKNDRK